jgi:hypothetical protein
MTWWWDDRDVQRSKLSLVFFLATFSIQVVYRRCALTTIVAVLSSSMLFVVVAPAMPDLEQPTLFAAMHFAFSLAGIIVGLLTQEMLVNRIVRNTITNNGGGSVKMSRSWTHVALFLLTLVAVFYRIDDRIEETDTDVGTPRSLVVFVFLGVATAHFGAPRKTLYASAATNTISGGSRTLEYAYTHVCWLVGVALSLVLVWLASISDVLKKAQLATAATAIFVSVLVLFLRVAGVPTSRQKATTATTKVRWTQRACTALLDFVSNQDESMM